MVGNLEQANISNKDTWEVMLEQSGNISSEGMEPKA